MNKKIIKTDKKFHERLIDVDDVNKIIFKNMINGFAVHEMIYDKNGNPIDCKFLYVNDAFSLITKIQNPVGKTIKEILPHIEQSWINVFHLAIKTGITQRVSKYGERTKTWYDMIIFKVDDNEFAISFTDITMSKASELKIKESSKLNNTLLDAIPHPAMLINNKREVLTSNVKARKMGAVVGQKCYNGFSSCQELCGKTGECCFCQRGLNVDDMDSKNLEIESYGHIWSTWWVPVGNNAFLYYAIDITNIRKSEENLIEAARELESSNQELEQFAYVASHDLQEPLRVVTTYCQLIDMFVSENFPKKMAKEKKRELTQYIDFTKDATSRMSFLIKDLLEFSRVGKIAEPYEIVPINEILINVIKDFDIFSQEDIVVRYPDMPTIMGRKRRISQVFHNIISNAIKFNSSKRKLEISIHFKERKHDWFFNIQDNGIGIAEDQLERIFGIFKRLHSRDEYPGTGIGLALVKKIIDNHGGEIWVESELDVGSTFFFTIPKSWEMIKLKK